MPRASIGKEVRTYLGLMTNGDGSMDEKVEHRIGTTTRMIRAMSRKVVEKDELSRKMKTKVHNAVHTHIPVCHGYKLWT